MRVTDPTAVEQLCEQYHFSHLTWGLTDDGEISIWGYDLTGLEPISDDQPAP